MYMRTVSFIFAMMVVFLLALTGCANSSQANAAENTVNQEQTKAEETLKTFTRDELKKYDGQNGNPAYIAVDGKVYDVTSVEPWKGGKHNGYGAGKDLTEEIKTKSPHGVAKLNGIPVVGTLVD
jgi:predicted heme/steroid binding protein